MGKRKLAIVLSSSDDEVQTNSVRRPRGDRKFISKPLSPSPKRTRMRRSKEGKDRCSDFRRSPKVQSNKFATLSDDFCGCLQDFHLTRGNQCTDCKELWVDKYKPSSIDQLSVHKKKVEEVKRWLEERLMTSKERFENILVLTGRAGVGKSVTVRVIAKELGAQLCEWTTPTPTLWQEHVHNVNSGLRYMSKLDEFEAFAAKIGKYSLLCPSTGTSSKPYIILIDDLPVTNGRVAFGRLKKCLTTLISSTQLPTIILITEFHTIEFGDNSTNYCEELISLLQRCGAHKVAFNPITANSIKIALFMLCQEEKCVVTPGLIDRIAKSSGGDIRNAITSLQYWCLKPDNLFISPASFLMEINTKVDTDHSESSPITGVVEFEELSSRYLPCGRDETLSLFHALGKFLHNKREIVDEFNLGSESILEDKYVRKPLKMEAPEKVLSQAYGQARPVTDFLHENVLDFISDGAIGDALLVTSYLSDSDCLLGSAFNISRSRILDEMYESQTLSQSVASSVAIRGVLFGNSQPVSSRWYTIRSPRLWQIEHSAKRNMNLAMKEKCGSFNGLSLSITQIITEYKPSIRWFSYQTTGVLDREKDVKHPINQVHSPDPICPDGFEEDHLKQEIGDEIED